MAGKPEGYIDVATRLAEFREKYPTGSLQPAYPAMPYAIETVGDKTFLVYYAAAYRTPDDERPGIGAAWEPIPGPTNFTRDSELQNAETSAWGRALVAVLSADTHGGVASAEEVQNRSGERAPRRETGEKATDKQIGFAKKLLGDKFGGEWPEPVEIMFDQQVPGWEQFTKTQISAVIDLLNDTPAVAKAERVGRIQDAVPPVYADGEEPF